MDKWRGGKISIRELEGIWDANTELEIAKGLILALGDMDGISREDKVKFLVTKKSKIVNLSQEAEVRFLYRPTLEVFFELVPLWDEDLAVYCEKMVGKFAYYSKEDHKGFESKIKKFINSLLNTKKKEEMSSYLLENLPSVLIKNEMFKELINYDFVSDKVETELLKLIPFKDSDLLLGWGIIKNQERAKRLLTVLKENREPRIVSTLLQVLAKKGDLEKIFGVE